MAKENKVLNTYVRNRLIGSGLLCSVLLAFFWTADSNVIRKQLNLPQKNNISTNTRMNIMIKILITLCCLLIFGSHVYDTKENAKTKFSDLTKKYLAYVSKTYPEAAHVQEIINNPVALQQLCTFICNSLTPEDQDKIIKLISQLDIIYAKPMSKKEFQNIPVLKNKIENEILDIVKNRVIIDDDVIKSLVQQNIICFNNKENLQR